MYKANNILFYFPPYTYRIFIRNLSPPQIFTAHPPSCTFFITTYTHPQLAAAENSGATELSRPELRANNVIILSPINILLRHLSVPPTHPHAIITQPTHVKSLLSSSTRGETSIGSAHASVQGTPPYRVRDARESIFLSLLFSEEEERAREREKKRGVGGSDPLCAREKNELSRATNRRYSWRGSHTTRARGKKRRQKHS